MAALDDAVLAQVLINIQVVELLRLQAVEEQRRDRDAALAQQAPPAPPQDPPEDPPQAAQVPGPRRGRRQRRPPKWWTSPWANPYQRVQYGNWDNLMVKLRADDPEEFFKYLRMTPALFDELLNRLTPRIERQDTRFRKAIQPGLKLAVTLRHLATGDEYPSLAYEFRLSRKTIAKFVPEVCHAIHQELVDDVMLLPSDEAGWRRVEEQFRLRWNVPHAIGAMDGKHIRIKKPEHTGGLYHNYKGFFSIILFAVVDADYKFLYTDVGGMGHQSDCQIYNGSEIKQALDTGALNLPAPDPLPNDDQDMPYFFIGDDAFPLRDSMMKPFSQRGLNLEKRVYNYRISRGRRVVENAFGILAQRWRCFLGCMQQKPENVVTLVHAAVCLHNFLRMRLPGALRDRHYDREDADHNLIPGEWRQEANLVPMDARHQGRRELEEAKRQRQTLAAYFSSPAGSVPWQNEMVNA